ncbi:MAG: metalloprotease PmbA [Gammaproteobacteria bacterium]
MVQQALATKVEDFVDPKQLEQRVKMILSHAKQLGATQAEVGTVSSLGLSVTARMSEVETVEFNRDKGVGITVYIGQKKGSASTSDLSQHSLQLTVEAAIKLAKLAEEDPAAGLADPLDLAKQIKPLELYYPWDISVDEAIHLAIECEKAALTADKRIVNSDGATLSTHQSFQVYGNSHGFIGSYPTSRHSISCVVMGSANSDQMERSYDYTVNRNPKLLKNVEQIGLKAADKTLQKLNGQRIQTQKAAVMFDAEVASSLWGHLLAAISGGNLYRKTSFLLNAVGQSILPKFINIMENPHWAGRLGSAPFDSDGVQTREKDIIREGILRTYLLSAYSARKLNLPNTGNAGGAHNVMVEPYDLDKKVLLQKMERGLLVTELMGQGVNITTGDYSRGVGGFWVENGEIQYPVHEITIAGNLRDMFKNILCVGNDIDERSNILTGSVLIKEMMIAGS